MYDSVTSYTDYLDKLRGAAGTVLASEYDAAVLALLEAKECGWPVIVMGNGGSAAIAEHFVCDLWKGVATDCDLWSNVINLGSNQALLTAIANDIGYEDVFSFQIDTCNSSNALVIAISSSGNSKNILNGLASAKEKKYKTIALVGFDGGSVKRGMYPHSTYADIILHVQANNYGIVEDAHSAIMHSMIQYIRKTYTDKEPHELKL